MGWFFLELGEWASADLALMHPRRQIPRTDPRSLLYSTLPAKKCQEADLTLLAAISGCRWGWIVTPRSKYLFYDTD